MAEPKTLASKLNPTRADIINAAVFVTKRRIEEEKQTLRMKRKEWEALKQALAKEKQAWVLGRKGFLSELDALCKKHDIDLEVDFDESYRRGEYWEVSLSKRFYERDLKLPKDFTTRTKALEEVEHALDEDDSRLDRVERSVKDHVLTQLMITKLNEDPSSAKLLNDLTDQAEKLFAAQLGEDDDN